MSTYTFLSVDFTFQFLSPRYGKISLWFEEVSMFILTFNPLTFNFDLS